MLDQETKRKIDTARDILVGKVPDPKAQVEQITTALIYKFMDDMDNESVDIGGGAEFFRDGLTEYSWSKLIDRSLSGQQRLDLYTQGISNISRSAHIPPLFKDIFEGAFLPYNDPETLNLFLKEIHGFSYDNSENLGNAFEYLLSILGSQGDAGQFRTPRHIIDFIVEVVAPAKEENILDPACGTAGFLISAYKYIYKTNSSNYDSQTDVPTFAQTDDKDITDLQIQSNGRYKGDQLTMGHKRSIQKHIIGYDISPDMVRLSLVNLYLHQFTKPNIHEYDTLTSEIKWDDDFNVIFANPPFMTPKGGIRPHKKFQIQANRSEVLFVDYIAEHLGPKGRAGVIVPEGIIFQASNAYKALRKMLVEEYLWAVASLPQGVFNPYSGVKTSILFMDKALAKKADKILFVKVENDGFDLGAQRRRIDKNDLTKACEILQQYHKSQQIDPEENIAHLVSKERISEDGHYNLSGGRYKEVIDHTNMKWPMVRLGEVCDDILSGGTPSTKNEDYWKGDIPWITSADIVSIKKALPRRYITKEAIKESATNLIKKGNIVVVTRVGLGKLLKNDFDVCISQDSQGLIVNDMVDVDYLVYLLKDKVEHFKEVSQGSTIQGVTKKQLSEIQIPLPPLEVQKKIVAEIKAEQKAVEECKKLIQIHEQKIKDKIEEVWG